MSDTHKREAEHVTQMGLADLPLDKPMLHHIGAARYYGWNRHGSRISLENTGEVEHVTQMGSADLPLHTPILHQLDAARYYEANRYGPRMPHGKKRK